MWRVIGIDFGTSTTYMNVKRYNGDRPDGDTFSYMPVVFNYGESSGYVATIVRENSDGSFDFGEKATELLEGARIHTEIKMRLESPDEEQRREARRITKAFFRFLHETYVQQAGNLGGAGDEEETVVSYPVKWQKETAQFMLEAAREAGFQHVSGMDEAEAAVAAVVSQSGDGRGVIYGDKPGYLLLIDMGAGTTDLVVCWYHRGEKGFETEMVANWPQDTREPTFGGREIDAMLEKYVEKYLAKSLNPALAPQAHVIASAPGQAKMWKERNVSVTLGAGKEVNTCAYIGTYRTMGMLNGEFPVFGREKFEAYLEGGLKEYVRLVKGCLDEAARRDEMFASEGLDLVILTGGHSAWYFAREILTGAMEGWLDHPALAAVRENPYRVVSLPNPQSTVALGLVYSRLLVGMAQQKPEIRPNAHEKAEGQPEREDLPEVFEDSHLQKESAKISNNEQEPENKTNIEEILCPVCHKKNKAGGNFCGHCGALLKENHPEKESDTAARPYSDAYYRQKAEEYLKSKSYEFPENMKKYSKKVLKIPDSETIFYHASGGGDGEFYECALSTTGVYFKKGLIGKTKHLSWTEFANIRWTHSLLDSFKFDPASVISSGFSGKMLEDIHACLQEELAQVQKVQTAAEPGAPDPSVDSEKADSSEQSYKPIDRSKCPNCGTKIPEGAKKCSICGCKARILPAIPFKLGFMSLFNGEAKIGVSKATGTLTVYDDRLEFKRLIGNAATVLTPYTLVYSAVRANMQPRDVYWMRDISKVKVSKNLLGVPSIILTMRAGEVYTFLAGLNTQAAREMLEDAVELIMQRL